MKNLLKLIDASKEIRSSSHPKIRQMIEAWKEVVRRFEKAGLHTIPEYRASVTELERLIKLRDKEDEGEWIRDPWGNLRRRK